MWDACEKRLVQELAGIRKWNAPSSVCYMGFEKAFWVRDSTLWQMTWTADAAGAGAADAAAVPESA